MFGCGLFGQLGNGENKKRTSPIRVDFKQTLHWEGIDDRMSIIAAGFFHNLAVSEDGLRLYMWGCNPQVCDLLRIITCILWTACPNDDFQLPLLSYMNLLYLDSGDSKSLVVGV